ncbi:MAG: YkvA family protein [Deinococcales bacterium]
MANSQQQNNASTQYEGNYQGHYFSEKGFWQKITGLLGTVSQELLEKALWLYHAAIHPNTPRRAKITAYAALAYFISPLDAIPDIFTGIGFTDDLTVLVLTLNTLARHITPEVKVEAAKTLDKLMSQFRNLGRAFAKDPVIFQEAKDAKALPKPNSAN